MRPDWSSDASRPGSLGSSPASIGSNYVPYLDMGDFVIVTNAEKIRLTGREARREGVPPPHGVSRRAEVGRRRASSRRSIPERMIEDAVRGMLPKSKLGRKQLKKLKVYRGAKHPHEAQQPRADEGPGVGRHAFDRARRNLGSRNQHRATGRRKTSMARVRLVPGTGAITVNKRSIDDYFPNKVLKMIIKQPLRRRRRSRSSTSSSRSPAAGRRGQAGAIRHGISRALHRVQPGAPQEAQEGRLPDARPADEGTQEVRPARRARPVPVHQAVKSIEVKSVRPERARRR